MADRSGRQACNCCDVRSCRMKAAAVLERIPIAPGQLLINGRWVDSVAGETMAVTDPTTEATITRVQKASARGAERAIDAAHKALETGPWDRLTHADRAK